MEKVKKFEPARSMIRSLLADSEWPIKSEGAHFVIEHLRTLPEIASSYESLYQENKKLRRNERGQCCECGEEGELGFWECTGCGLKKVTKEEQIEEENKKLKEDHDVMKELIKESNILPPKKS